MAKKKSETYFPVLGISLQHERILGLANLARIVVLNLLHILLRLHPLVLGEGSLVPLSTCVGEEVRSDRLDFELRGLREAGRSLEVFLRIPALGEDGKRELVFDDDHGGSLYDGKLDGLRSECGAEVGRKLMKCAHQNFKNSGWERF
jgi:hypothetical protein